MVTPYPATSLLLLRDGESGIEVFMVERPAGPDIFGGALVFPGGRVDPADGTMTPETRFGAAFRHAALRELFEETGFLLARDRRTGQPVEPARAEGLALRYRHPIGATALDFGTWLETEDLIPALDDLVPFAHWITPPSAPKRFDTRFFAAAAFEGQSGRHDGSELVQSLWLTQEAALERYRLRTATLMFVTRCTLSLLQGHASVAAALAAARSRPIVTVCPEVIETPDGRKVRIPADAGYGITEDFLR